MPIRSYASRSCQSAVGQTETTLGDRLAVVEPDLHADARGARGARDREQVVVHEKRFGFGAGAREPLPSRAR